MKLFAKIFFITIVTVVIFGCANIKDPLIFTEKINGEKNLPLKNVLVIIDLSLEYDDLPSGLAFSKNDNAKKMYEPLAAAMVNEVKNSGVGANFLLHTSRATYGVPKEYSHVWIQKLVKFKKVTSNSGSYVHNRVWQTFIQENMIYENKKLNTIFYSEYESDGARCFLQIGFNNSADCQNKYLEIAKQQWKKFILTLNYT